jgi:hypothetical protein
VGDAEAVVSDTGRGEAMAMRGASIRMFLVDGEPDGLRVVEKSNWSGVVLIAARADQERLRKRPELSGPGVYLLLGPTESTELRRVYVGEAEDAAKRIGQHVAKGEDFWNTIVVLTSKDGFLNKAHVRWLESRLIHLATHSGRAALTNGTVGSVVKISEADTADMESYLDEALVLLPVLGVDAFQVLEESAAAGHVELYLTGPGTNAVGYETSEGFVVKAGATARVAWTNSAEAGFRALRERLVREGVFEQRGSGLVLTRQYAFTSPSTAASVLLARSANGRTKWRAADGRTLKEIQEQEIEAELGVGPMS